MRSARSAPLPGPGVDRGRIVAFVIVEPCVDVKDGECAVVCPVECIYEGGRMLYIQPDECINCALCVSVCPVEAIFDEDDVPDDATTYVDINREFFGPDVTGWGAPGGAGPAYVTALDHPAVAALARRAS